MRISDWSSDVCSSDLALNVILVAVDEHDDVGVLLDRAGLAQVGELRALVLALLDGARELREGEDRHIEILGQGLEAAGDLRDLLHAVVGALVDRRLHELQVVDHNEAEAVLALQAAGAGATLADRGGGGGDEIGNASV